MEKTNEKSILISTATGNPENMEAMKEYSVKAMELIKNSGGVILGRHPIIKTILGEKSPSAVLIAEFPNDNAITELFESEVYKSLIPLRSKGYKEVNFYLAR